MCIACWLLAQKLESVDQIQIPAEAVYLLYVLSCRFRTRSSNSCDNTTAFAHSSHKNGGVESGRFTACANAGLPYILKQVWAQIEAKIREASLDKQMQSQRK